MTAMKTFCDLFCGIGGFHLALSSRGLKCVFASDIDEAARKVYAANFGIEPAGDITKIEAKDIPPHDVLCGGFPCQPFSLANTKAKGFEDTRGTLFFDIARIAEYHKPKMLMLENVPRITSFDKGRVMATILRTLDELGYNCWTHKLNAADYGCATARRRIYFVAIRKDLDLVSEVPPRSAKRDCVLNHLRPDLDTKDLERPIDDYIFGRHPNPPANPQGTKLIARHKRASRSHRPQGNRVYDVKGAYPTMVCASDEAVFIPDGGDYLLPEEFPGEGKLKQNMEASKQSKPTEPQRLGFAKKCKTDKSSGRKFTQGKRVYDPTHPAPSITAQGGGDFGNTEGFLMPGKNSLSQIGEHKDKGSMQGYRVYDPTGVAPTQSADAGGELPGGGFLVPDRPVKVGGHKKYPNSVGARIYAPEGPAVSFNASCGGKFGRTGGYRIEGVVRRLHVEEAKTIQGFPPEHIIAKGGQGYKQIGNSVIPRMIEVLFDAIVPGRAAQLV